MKCWQWLALVGCGVIIYGEFLGDYIALGQCSWPEWTGEQSTKEPILRAMILADTHLLGPFRGHWLDKLYREWHMHRAYVAANTLFQPEAIFILGDLFDEGEFVNHDQFEEYVDRFRHLFPVQQGSQMINVVGNHDVGFHYRFNPYTMERFHIYFNNTGVNLYTINGVNFVFVNSMAMENDGCNFCEEALRELQQIKRQLSSQHVRSPPIIMQHFPTYRRSNVDCLEHDAPVLEKFRENWEVLSRKSTKLLGDALKPRLAFAGHSHHYCRSLNSLGIEEFTVASFSWRNKINPSFMLATLSPNSYAVRKCDMLKQQKVYAAYIACAILYVVYMLYCLQKCIHRLLHSIRYRRSKVA